MTPHPEDWLPEHVAALRTSIAEMWPSAPPAACDDLANGVLTLVRRRRLTTAQVFPALVDAAEESDRGYIVNVGAVAAALARRRARREGLRPREPQRQIEDRSRAQPWAPALWTAAFVHAGGPDRVGNLRGALRERMRPWLVLVAELGLRPEHGIEGPEADEARVAEANKRAAEVWRTSGGISESAALKAMGGWGR